jgi:hypothetical protein
MKTSSAPKLAGESGVEPALVNTPAPQLDSKQLGVIDQFNAMLQAATGQNEIFAAHEWILESSQFSQIEKFPGISQIINRALKQASDRIAELPPPVSTSVPTIVAGKIVEKHPIKRFEGDKSSILFTLSMPEGRKVCGARNSLGLKIDQMPIGASVSLTVRLPNESEAAKGLDFVALKVKAEVPC